MGTKERKFVISEEALTLIEKPQEIMKLFMETSDLQKEMNLCDEELMSFFHRGVTAFDAGNYEGAVNMFTLLTALRPLVPNFWIGLGSALQAMSRFDEALNAFKVAIIASPHELSGYIHAARCGIEMHDFDHALEILDVGVAQVESGTPGIEESLRDVLAMQAYVKMTLN